MGPRLVVPERAGAQQRVLMNYMMNRMTSDLQQAAVAQGCERAADNILTSVSEVRSDGCRSTTDDVLAASGGYHAPPPLNRPLIMCARLAQSIDSAPGRGSGRAVELSSILQLLELLELLSGACA